MPLLLLPPGGGPGPYPWNHNYVAGDYCFHSAAAVPFINAINERLKAIGMLTINDEVIGKKALKPSYSLPGVNSANGLYSSWADEVRGGAGQGTVLFYDAGSGIVTTDIFKQEISPGVFTYRQFLRSDPSWVPTIGEACVAYSRRFLPPGIIGVVFPQNDHGYYPTCSWPDLQAIVYNLAAFYFSSDEGDRTGVDVNDFLGLNLVDMPRLGSSPGTYHLDYAHWPPPNGFTRYRPKFITSLADTLGFPAGSRVVFVVDHAGFTSNIGFGVHPNTTISERQYSGKIMKMVGGVWTVDTDQDTPVPYITADQGGPWFQGDVFQPENLNELADAINILTVIARYGCNFDIARRGPYSNTDPLSRDTVAHAKANAEAVYTASAIPPYVNQGIPYSSISPIAPVGATYSVKEASAFFQCGATIQNTKIQFHDSGFQGNFADYSILHNFSSAIDTYMVTTYEPSTDSSEFFIDRTYDPPVAGMVDNKYHKLDSLPPSNSDDRVGAVVGSHAIPPAPSGPATNRTSMRGWAAKNGLCIQKFRVIGGFENV